MQYIYILVIMVGFTGAQSVCDQDGPLWLRFALALVACLALYGFEIYVERRTTDKVKEELLKIKDGLR